MAGERGAGTKHHFHFRFSKKLSLSLTLYQPPGLNNTKIYKEWLRPSPKPKSQDHLVVSVGWLSLCRVLCAVKAKTGFKPTICCLGYSLKYPLFDIFTFFLFCFTILYVYGFIFFASPTQCACAKFDLNKKSTIGKINFQTTFLEAWEFMMRI